jgi:hypothetical protein
MCLCPDVIFLECGIIGESVVSYSMPSVRAHGEFLLYPIEVCDLSMYTKSDGSIALMALHRGDLTIISFSSIDLGIEVLFDRCLAEWEGDWGVHFGSQ